MKNLAINPDEVEVIGRKTVKKILLSFGGMLVFSIIIIVGLVAISARSQNQIAEQQSRNLVNSLLKERLNQLVQLNVSNSTWRKVAQFTPNGVDEKWVESKIGRYLYDTFGITDSFVVGRDNQTMFAMKTGKRSGEMADQFIGSDFSILVRRVRETAKHNQSGITFGFTKNDGGYYLTTASRIGGIVSASDTGGRLTKGGILIYSIKLDSNFLRGMERSFGLNELKIVENQSEVFATDVALSSIGNEYIGHLTWKVDLPGDKMLLWVLPASSIAIILYILVMIFIYRQAGNIAVALNSESSQAKKYEAAYLETESRFKAFIDNTPSAIVVKDVNGRYLVANKTWNDWFNPENLNVAGRKAPDFFSEDSAKQFEGDDSLVLTNGENIYEEHQVSLAGGRNFSILAQKFPIKNGAGKIVAIGLLGTDISERKEIEKGLREAKHIAEMANKSKTEFLANMSHELRTPLNAILGFSDILKAEAFGPLGQENYLEYAHDINAAGKHLLDVINEILDVAKIEAGQMVLAEKNLDVRYVLESCQRMVGVRAKDAGVKLKFEIAQNLPPLFADETRIKQILNNLLSNAIKFTDPNGTVTVIASLTNKEEMQLTVKDNGVGIKEEDMKTILSQFGQAQSSYARNHEGTGLGLTLVQLLVEAHEGIFEMESVFGEGTLATVTFPNTRILQAA